MKERCVMNASLEMLAILAGVLTVLSPCILPILPAILSTSVSSRHPHRPFWIVLGLGTSFAIFGASFAVFKNVLGLSNTVFRDGALIILLFFGISLLFPRVWEHIGSSISGFVQSKPWMSHLSEKPGPLGTFLLGSALGLLWAPCAGPILGIILTLATIQPSFLHTFALMGGYALGASLPMLLIGYGGQKMATKFFFFRRVGSIAPKIMGVMTIGVVVGLYFNLDTTLLSRLPSTLFLSNVLEKKLVALKPINSIAQTVTPTSASVPSALPVLGTMPAFSGIDTWVNSPPLTRHSLRGKVVLIDFWTYSCINCIRTLPYVERWYQKYKDQGLVIIGVHTPEFSFEKKVSNIEDAVKRFGITYPVAIDSRYGTWNAYGNQFWPAHYLIDASGKIREVHFGEGKYRKTEADIQSLLKEAGELNKNIDISTSFHSVDFSQIQSPETYLGYARATNFKSSQEVDPDSTRSYSFPLTLNLNEWALRGKWTIKGDKILLNGRKGAIEFRFHSPKLNIVMKGTETGVPAHVYLDGKPLSPSMYGADLSKSGMVNVQSAKLYNLVTLPSTDTRSHLLEIRFKNPGVSAYTFTFG